MRYALTSLAIVLGLIAFDRSPAWAQTPTPAPTAPVVPAVPAAPAAPAAGDPQTPPVTPPAVAPRDA